MSAYSVAEAKNSLPSLIDKAAAGEEVVITRHGRPVAELRPTSAQAAGSPVMSYEWLRTRRAKRKPVGRTSVELLDDMYEETRR